MLSVRSEVRQFAKRIPALRSVVVQLRTLGHELIPRTWIFTDIYTRNGWGDPDSTSGEGSNLTQTQRIRQELPALWRRYGVRCVPDAPCGDFHWMREVANSLDEYVGSDIVAALVDASSRRYGNHRVRFRRALENMRSSGASYLLTTTFTDRTHNEDIHNGKWRPLNVRRSPFNFPQPIEILNERCTQFGRQYAGKSLALWRFADLPCGPVSRKR